MSIRVRSHPLPCFYSNKHVPRPPALFLREVLPFTEGGEVPTAQTEAETETENQAPREGGE